MGGSLWQRLCRRYHRQLYLRYLMYLWCAVALAGAAITFVLVSGPAIFRLGYLYSCPKLALCLLASHSQLALAKAFCTSITLHRKHFD